MNGLNEVTQSYSLSNYSAAKNTEGGINIDEFTNILRRKLPLILGCTVGVTTIAMLKVLITPPTYIAEFELLSEPINIETKVTSTNEDSRKTREEITYVDLNEVQLKILKSPRLISQVVELLKKKYPELSYESLSENLTVEIISDSQEKQNVLRVVYTDPDKQKVSDVIDTLTKTYQDYSVEKRQSGVKRGIEFLDGQIPRIYSRSQELEAKITRLRTQYSFNNPETSLDQITSRISQLDLRREENNLKIQELKLDLSNLELELEMNPAKIISGKDFTTPEYAELLGRMRELNLETNQKSVVFSDQSQVMQDLKQQKKQLNLLIAEAGETIRSKLVNKIVSLENHQQNLAAETKKLRLRLEQWSEISGEYKSLQHQLNMSNAKLNEFTSQKDALQIDSAQQDSPWQLLTPAQEPVTNGMKKSHYMLIGSTLGLTLGIGLAVLIDKQQKIIYSSAKIEEITSLPVLSAIPHNSEPKQLPFTKSLSFQTKDDQLALKNTSLQKIKASQIEYSAPFMESFRSFAANLGLLNFNSNSDENCPRSLIVTSAIPGEGKSTVALNLARATASMGKQVLVIDTNLRSTNHLSNKLGLGLEIGLRNILESNIFQSRLKYIQKSPLEDNLFILSSGFNNITEGNTYKDPSQLLASVEMNSLMKEFENQFDLVIYDLCSVIGFADVNLLAGQTDGIVLVTGLGKIQSRSFTEALNQLQLSNANVLGIALNKVVARN